jgi:hypothetical protein
MALHLNIEEHDADPPEGWTVRKAGERLWQLCDKDGGVLQSTKTKKEAEALKTSGFFFNLYHDEGRWFRGEAIHGWKPYAVCKAEREAQETRNKARAASA